MSRSPHPHSLPPAADGAGGGPTGAAPTAAPAAARRPRSGARRRRSMLAVVATVVLAAVVPLAQSASAERPRCPDGSYPPCPGDPDPEPPPPPPPATWRVNVMPLIQPGATALGSVTADRSWRTLPVLEQTSQAQVQTAEVQSQTPVQAQVLNQAQVLTQAQVQAQSEPGQAVDGGVLPPVTLPTIGTVTPAGSASMIGTALDFPATPMPPYSTMEMRLREAGVPGSLCRISGIAPLPASGRPLHLLVPKSITRNASDLNAMVSSFLGPQTGLPAGTTLTITATTLVPQAGGLLLGIQGDLGVGSFQFKLDYHLLLNLDPGNSAAVNTVLTVRAPNPGTVALTWVGTPPPDGDAILAYVQAVAESPLRSAVLAKAGPQVNQAVLGLHDVKWWTEQGFTLSIRRVSYSTAGLTVDPALCRLS